MPSLIDDFLGEIFMSFCEKYYVKYSFLKFKNLQKPTQLSTILKGA
jgi:hypothetical protein